MTGLEGYRNPFQSLFIVLEKICQVFNFSWQQHKLGYYDIIIMIELERLELANYNRKLMISVSISITHKDVVGISERIMSAMAKGLL